ncbi:MAG: hypothetical protein FJ134_10540 [Deltaproteobacteria bacterium]|nr:hypothetical protein [Deltaproteobacteria bacterium]
MKDGLIVYLVNSPEPPEGFDAVQAAENLGEKAEQIEVVSAREGFFTVEDAWHFLLTRGCGRIRLLVAQAEDDLKLRPLGPAVRLCG